ncbi:hypothetical protein MJ904_11460 [Massilia sp. MB5]|uniref:hypothetical protein n=1 Tax=unclassified Massilia TaxID=2609279 RepID=UPI00067B0243|nr:MULTISPECIES: hypothetical protein [unclassified Massilia]AKU22495.1 hypothetical protein ACZ75_14465 [Massilia sp. NR 4-1]UMR32720.1 hypothetical protein MJ904_11460 [Massilia sp. MB5]
MYKKAAIFMFAAAAALSASFASANDCQEMCYEDQQYCLDLGTKPPICARILRQCLARCPL